MKIAWTAGVEGDAEEGIKSSFKSGTLIRRRLTEICKKRVEGCFILTKDSYDVPNWEYKQADAVGYRRALEEVISLLT